MNRTQGKTSGKKTSRAIDAMLNLNDLQYVAHTDASVGIQRQLKIRYPDKNSYTQSQRMVFRLGNDDFIDFNESSLYFVWKHTGGDTATFGNNNALGLFNRVRVLTPDGEAISDVQHLNVFQAINYRMKNSAEYAISGAAFGEGGVNYAQDTDHPFTIPLRMLSPFFRSDTLVPPQITQ
ncbi:unnamed protein product, partial [marine sediment metagenome]